MERHKILLEWIERQRREITAAYAEKAGDQGQVKRDGSRALRNHTEASRPSRFSISNNGKHKGSRARSILSPVDPARVSKAARKKPIAPRQKVSILYDAAQSAEKTTIDPEPLTREVSGHPRSKTSRSLLFALLIHQGFPSLMASGPLDHVEMARSYRQQLTNSGGKKK